MAVRNLEARFEHLASGERIATTEGFVNSRGLVSVVVISKFDASGAEIGEPQFHEPVAFGRIAIDGQQRLLRALTNSTGGTSPQGGTTLTVCRTRTTDGIDDPTFGEGGCTQVTNLPAGYPVGVRALPSGSVLAASRTSSSQPSEVILVRLTASGARDTHFGTNGVLSVTTAMGTVARSVDVQSDGRILLSLTDGRLVRLTEAGELDASFGDAGVISGVGGEIQVRANDQFLVVDAPNRSLHRYLAHGAPDESFGAHGKVDLPEVTKNTGTEFWVRAVSEDTDGRIYVTAVFMEGSARKGLVARLTSNGSLDADFGVVTDLGPPSVSSVGGVTVGGNGMVWVAFAGLLNGVQSEAGLAQFCP